MAESYKGEYSATDWAEKFLANAMDEFPDDNQRMQFRGIMDVNKIQENEARDFLDAFKSGNTKKFLEDRANKQKEFEHTTPLQERPEIEPETHHKTAA